MAMQQASATVCQCRDPVASTESSSQAQLRFGVQPVLGDKDSACVAAVWPASLQCSDECVDGVSADSRRLLWSGVAPSQWVKLRD